MPSRAQALTPSATPTAPLLTKKASSPPVSAFAGWGKFTPPAFSTACLSKALTADVGGNFAIYFQVCKFCAAHRVLMSHTQLMMSLINLALSLLKSGHDVFQAGVEGH